MSRLVIHRLLSALALSLALALSIACAAPTYAGPRGGIVVDSVAAVLDLRSAIVQGFLAELVSDRSSSVYSILESRRYSPEVKFQPVTLQLEAGDVRALAPWIETLLSGKLRRCRLQLKPTSMPGRFSDWVDLPDGFLSRITFPGLDPATPGPSPSARIEITAPRLDRRTAPLPMSVPNGATLTETAVPVAIARFTVSIDGVDCSNVVAIDPIDVRCKVESDFIQERGMQYRMSSVTNEPFRLSAFGTGAVALGEWLESVANGALQGRMRSIQVNFLAADGTALYSLKGRDACILYATPAPTSIHPDAVKAGLFANQWTLLVPIDRKPLRDPSAFPPTLKK
jgi:hypothetical protein